MSNTATRLCRALPMSPAQKAVLMCIADRANESGVAWPSLPGICEWTCLKRTAVIEAMKWLEANKLIVVTRIEGKNNSCALALAHLAALQPDDPSATRTGPADGPVRETDPTRPADGPPPVRETDPTRPADGPEASISTIQAPTKHQKRKRASGKTSLPPDFAISDAVRAWASEHGHASALNAHHEAFVDKCLAKGYEYADWDAAFRNAIKANWANLGSGGVGTGTSFTRDRTAQADAWMGTLAPKRRATGLFEDIDYTEGVPRCLP